MFAALRHGQLVELETEIGSIYVRPDTWERLYMVWTFRHFRTLPRQVLSRRQQAAIEGLCRTAVVTPEEGLHAGSIIGRIENVPVMAGLCRTVASVSSTALVAAVPVSAGPTNSDEYARVVNEAKGAVETPAPVNGRSRQPLSTTELSPEAPKANLPLEERGTTWLAWVFAGIAICAAILLGPGRSHLSSAGQGTPLPNSIATAAPSRPAPAKSLEATAKDSRVAIATVIRPEPTLQAGDAAEWMIPLLPLPKEEPHALAPHAIGPIAGSTAVPTRANFRPASEAANHALAPAASPSLSNIVERLGAPEGRLVRPDYPPGRISGSVVLQAIVQTDGRVQRVNVVSGNRTLAKAAATAMKSWRYQPYELNGTPVPFQTRVMFRFTAGEVISITFPAS
jgi:TonB family protein